MINIAAALAAARRRWPDPVARGRLYALIGLVGPAALICIYMIGWLAGLPTLLIFWSDSGSYLRPSLTWLGGGDYELSIRPIGYPWLLGWVIRLGGLDAIAPVQTV